ncbi:MAG: hypothetical protein EOO03_12230 [Chitinophagaceae bacterium]|nr:MAG: hypothetical protein EOO03_12230 [Chitinophagaceae bacterium]
MAVTPKIGDKLLQKLSKRYQPNTTINEVFKGNDISFVTDGNGDPKCFFIGKRMPNGTIKGDRFSRTLLFDENGTVNKNHWDYKGRTHG